MDKYIIRIKKDSTQQPPIETVIIRYTLADWELLTCHQSEYWWKTATLIAEDPSHKIQVCSQCYLSTLANHVNIGTRTTIEDIWNILYQLFVKRSSQPFEILPEQDPIELQKKYLAYLPKIYPSIRSYIYNRIHYYFNTITDEMIGKRIAEIQTILQKYTCHDCTIADGPCLTCFRKELSIKIDNEDQEHILWKLYKEFVGIGKKKDTSSINDHIKILCGSAGTGKTTLITYLFQIPTFPLRIAIHGHGTPRSLFAEGMKIIISAPTNKALDVIREKVNSVITPISANTVHLYDISLVYCTVSKLLSYNRYFDKEHNLCFRRSRKPTNVFTTADLIIIDECSMLNSSYIHDIKTDFAKCENKLAQAHMLLVGDVYQLPPPKERYSASFNLSAHTSNTNPATKYELKVIMRTKKDAIIKLAQFIRKWISDRGFNEDGLRERIMSFADRERNVLFFEDQITFLQHYADNIDGSIILVWTNECKRTYNIIIRNKMFGKDATKQKRFVIGERLIFNSFYKSKNQQTGSVVINHSSQAIRVVSSKIGSYKCAKITYEKIMKKLGGGSNYEWLKKFAEAFANVFSATFDVWNLTVRHTSNNLEPFDIRVIYNFDTYNKSIMQGKQYIKSYIDGLSNVDPNLLDIIHEAIIDIFDEYYVSPFAEVDYGYAMTVDKSQGSTFENVFIDAPDILDPERHKGIDNYVAKKRFYTAITRSANSVVILL